MGLVGKSPPGAFRICLDVPGLGCTIVYVQNTSLDVRLSATSDVEQLVTLRLAVPTKRRSTRAASGSCA